MDEMRRFVEATRLPFVVKGVLSVHDALKCKEIGARGIQAHDSRDFVGPLVGGVQRERPAERIADHDDGAVFRVQPVDRGRDHLAVLARGQWTGRRLRRAPVAG